MSASSGLLDRLDYLQALGITALYLNPINDAPSLHKYDAAHYQHVDRNFGPDFERGWGRASVPADYFHDRPHLLGTMRTGPDLLNIGVRQPSQDWHLGHLYQPRAYVPGSNMPAYRYLFVHKDAAEDGDVVVALPPGQGVPGKVTVATRDATDLVRYLQSLDRSYPVLPASGRP